MGGWVGWLAGRVGWTHGVVPSIWLSGSGLCSKLQLALSPSSFPLSIAPPPQTGQG
jgi:hypothetical protein